MSVVDILHLLRPYQWVKNLFVLAPLVFTVGAVTGDRLLLLIMGTLLFCFMASAVYIFNDFCDRVADRAHPTKKLRPLAAKRIAAAPAIAIMAVLAALGLLGGWLVDQTFFLVLLIYAVLNLAYSLWFKHVAVVDVLLVAAGFVLRLQAGGTLVNVPLTPWIIVCTGLLALFLALAKRRDDLVRDLGVEHRPSLDGYNLKFLDAALVVIVAATFITYVLYTLDTEVISRMGSDKLYFTTPFVLAGLLRYLQLTLIDERSGDPTRLVFADRFMVITLILWMTVFMMLIYGIGG